MLYPAKKFFLCYIGRFLLHKIFHMSIAIFVVYLAEPLNKYTGNKNATGKNKTEETKKIVFYRKKSNKLVNSLNFISIWLNSPLLLT